MNAEILSEVKSAVAVVTMSLGDEVFTETVIVTPEIARAWLELNAVNRPISRRNVEALKWDIRHEKWVLTHQGVAFNRESKIIDGQHRLTAVVETGIAVPMRVTYNVDIGFHAPIDCGTARKVAHVLGETGRVIDVCNALWLLETGTATKLGPAPASAIRARHREGIDWAVRAVPYRPRRFYSAPVIAAFAYAYPADRERVAQFTHNVATLTLGASSPARALIRHLERCNHADSAREKMLVTLRALQAHCESESLMKLHASESAFEFFAIRRAGRGL